MAISLWVMISATDPFHLESQPLKLGYYTFSLIALNLDPAILDRASSAAPLLELGGKFSQCFIVHGHVKHRGHAFATPSCRLSPNLGRHRLLLCRYLFDLDWLWSFAAASHEASHQVHDLALDQGQGFGGIVNVPELHFLGKIR